MLPWLLITSVVGVGLWMVLDYRDRTGDRDPVAQAAEQSTETGGSADVTPAAKPTTPEPEPSVTAEEEKTGEPEKPVRLITEGVTVQVLNGTSDPEAGNAMAAELTGLGFQIVTVESSSKPYRATTVYWSFPDAKEAARALAEKHDWVADEKPANLADTVSLHVVVGKDFLD